MRINKTQKNVGFTLVELMVATTLFTIIMLMGVGSLVISSNSAKSAQKLRISVDNVNFAMESIARDLRMGTNYYCNTDDLYSLTSDIPRTNDCNNGGNVIEFNSPVVQSTGETHRIAYFKSKRPDGTSYTLKRCEIATGCADIVSNDVNINELKFYVKGSAIDDKIQPMAQILIKGTVTIKNKNLVKSFSLQTMASQRSAEK
ncbi:hypothetical protein HXX01_03605 [Candidatus Nomurabacteria bacterium]|nr:hypothetical protein [Candidatus Nomurabacteria bacterium]